MWIILFFWKTGYQITQQRKAIANNGQLKFVVYNPTVHKKPYYATSKIRQLQLEQDSGKSLHVPGAHR
jgi:aspartyl-tRNA(Asn)/glutamyl-tRNA(Gln) amidotransferase subunit B